MITAIPMPRVAADPATRDLVITEPEFEVLFADLAEGLKAYLTQRTRNPSLSEDLTQQSFVRLLGARLRTKDRPALKGYLYRIATNLANDHWRRSNFETIVDPVPERAIRPAPDSLRSDFDRLLGRLDDRERSLLWLAHVEEMSHREIAEILEVGEKSVKVMLFRARKKLASILRAQGYTGGGVE